MANRFTDSDKWRDKWFRALTSNEKLVFLFLIDNCDLAGFYEVDESMMSFQIGIPESAILGAVQGLNRGCLFIDGWVWLKNFLKHQKNENLNPENNAHKHIIARIESQRERFSSCDYYIAFLGANEGLFSPTGKGKGKDRGNGKGKDQPSDSEIDRGLTILLHSSITKSDPEYFNSKRKINMERWPDEFRKIRELDGRDIDAIRFVLEKFPADEFWSGNIRSPKALRGDTKNGADKFTTIHNQLKTGRGKKNNAGSIDTEKYKRLAKRAGL